MPADWRIKHWPRCTHHVFLSHCAEDRQRLVVPVDQQLQAAACLGWIDLRNYPLGRDPLEVLREEVLLCRHTVYFVTASMLQQGRAWTGAEHAYAALIQRNLRYGSNDVCHVQLPLFFVPQGHLQLARSAYAAIRHFGVFYPPGRLDAGAVAWATNQILSFVRQEQQWAVQIAANMQNDPKMRAYFQQDNNLERRVIAADPPPVP